MNIAAKDLWTGDIVKRFDLRVTALELLGIDGTAIEATLSEVMVVPDPNYPLVVAASRKVRFRASQTIEIVRDKAFPNGMHMTQLDARGMCHGRAHPALEQQLRAEGRMATA